MRKSLLAVAVVGLAVGSTTACATKGYVNTQVGQVSTKVDTLSGSLEETQERTRQNEAKITEVDGKAGAAQTAANTAQQAAMTADGKAVAAGDAAKMASARIEEVNKAWETSSRRIVYEVSLSEATPGFKFGATKLADETKAKIDAMIANVLADPKGSYFEIEGHTDDVGSTEINEKVGMERAEAVKLYLYEKHQIPLHRINVISYGEAKPANTGKTRAARAENRRVVIRVLN
jgi:outer membrane protein OmpA-like peptidoglycan-associated protein